MSTAVSTHHHSINPIAAATAVAVLLGGAAVVGVAMTQSDDPAASLAPRATAQLEPNPASRVGRGDFAPPEPSGQSLDTLKGGHSTIGFP
jgi:hypothetical protein